MSNYFRANRSQLGLAGRKFQNYTAKLPNLLHGLNAPILRGVVTFQKCRKS